MRPPTAEISKPIVAAQVPREVRLALIERAAANQRSLSAEIRLAIFSYLSHNTEAA